VPAQRKHQRQPVAHQARADNRDFSHNSSPVG
jgi:hypothetical protein